MTELEPWPLMRAQHRRMNMMFKHNRITNFTNNLQWSFDCRSPRVYETSLDLHGNDMRHITDAINGWNIAGKLTSINTGFY